VYSRVAVVEIVRGQALWYMSSLVNDRRSVQLPGVGKLVMAFVISSLTR
jgi:hypothetical protein